MKRLLLIILVAIAFCACKDDTNTVIRDEKEVYQELVDIKNAQKAELTALMANPNTTRSALILGEPPKDFVCPERIMYYIDTFALNFESINTDKLLWKINRDNALTEEDKLNLAEVLGCGEYLLETIVGIFPTTTRAEEQKTKAQCLEEWKVKVKDLIVDYLYDVCVAMITKNGLATASATFIAWMKNNAALDFYLDCIKTAKP